MSIEAMSVEKINKKIKEGKIIKICPWDNSHTNIATATVLSVGIWHVVSYRLDGMESTISRPVSDSIWRYIQEQAAQA